VSASEKSLTELLNSYLAIESLLTSRYTSSETRQTALNALRQLNEQFAKMLKGEQKENGEGMAAD
jgi:hypothetical protein